MAGSVYGYFKFNFLKDKKMSEKLKPFIMVVQQHDQATLRVAFRDGRDMIDVKVDPNDCVRIATALLNTIKPQQIKE